MKVSVIIPTLNEAANVARAIDSAIAAEAGEVIVVDGGSHDATREIAAGRDCTVLANSRGRAAQLNHGARHSTGEVLLFLHADNHLAADAVRQAIRALADGQVPGGAFRQRIDAPGRLFRLLERGNALRASRWGIPYGDQGIFLRRGLFERLGGFPEVGLMEDFLLMRRLRRIARPVLLPGPIHVSARRWQRHGVVRQTLRNWSLVTATLLGFSPDHLARFYRPHQSAQP